MKLLTIAVVGVVGALVAMALPEIKRYLKVRNM
jgi:hypothetical protein